MSLIEELLSFSSFVGTLGSISLTSIHHTRCPLIICLLFNISLSHYLISLQWTTTCCRSSRITSRLRSLRRTSPMNQNLASLSPERQCRPLVPPPGLRQTTLKLKFLLQAKARRKSLLCGMILMLSRDHTIP